MFLAGRKRKRVGSTIRREAGVKTRDTVMVDSGSQKMQHYLDVISHVFGSRFLLRMVQTKNSSDLERAPGAR